MSDFDAVVRYVEETIEMERARARPNWDDLRMLQELRRDLMTARGSREHRARSE